MQKQYICGCGKAYGSYPAYSTHRKLKHSNQTIEGTLLPSLDKAKRGRPSYDFKKIPKLNDNKKKYYDGLSLIENGLLELESDYRGKILSHPLLILHTNKNTEEIAESIDLSKLDNEQSEMSESIIQFTKSLIIHTQEAASKQIINFIRQLLQYLIESKQILQMEGFNNFFKQQKKLNYEWGIDFYLKVGVLLSKWLFLMGKSTQTLRYCGDRKHQNVIDKQNKGKKQKREKNDLQEMNP